MISVLGPTVAEAEQTKWNTPCTCVMCHLVVKWAQRSGKGKWSFLVCILRSPPRYLSSYRRFDAIGYYLVRSVFLGATCWSQSICGKDTDRVIMQTRNCKLAVFDPQSTCFHFILLRLNSYIQYSEQIFSVQPTTFYLFKCFICILHVITTWIKL